MKSQLSSTMVEGKEIKPGDWVGFKSDIEQGGRIIGIYRDSMRLSSVLILENKNGFDGDYIGGDTVTHQDARDCWREG